MRYKTLNNKRPFLSFRMDRGQVGEDLDKNKTKYSPELEVVCLNSAQTRFTLPLLMWLAPNEKTNLWTKIG